MSRAFPVRVKFWKTSCLLLVVVGFSFVAGQTIAELPHMQNALAALEVAKTELQVTEVDKGGHRVKALAFVDKAIAETKEGIAAGSR